MNRLEHSHALMKDSEATLSTIEGLYKQSLSSKDIGTQLPIRIKNFLDNLRSSLDFIAREIFERFCVNAVSGKTIQVYFPILRSSANQQDFDAFMNGRFPSLKDISPPLYAKLESYQVFKSKDNDWLTQFNELCQENKHEQLSPQIRTEDKSVRLSDDKGRSVSWNEGVKFGPGGGITFGPGGKLTFGPGGSVEFGPSGPSILGRRVDPNTQGLHLQPGDKFENVVWVDFKFKSNDVSVMPFLRQCLTGVKNILGEMESEIKKVSP